MKRWHPLAVTTCGLAVLSISLTGVPSQAATPTCQGLPVTGSTGTDGDDVLLIDTALTAGVSAGPGNDVICIVGERFLPSYDAGFGLDAGPGDDIVENRATVDATVYLGSGKDTYSGSDARDWVTTGSDSSTSDGGSAEADKVSTNGGEDIIYSGSLLPGSRNEDVIDTGSGRDQVRWSGSGGTLINGPTPDSLVVVSDGVGADAPQAWTRDVVVDNSTRSATSGSEVLLTWTNVDDFRLPASTRLIGFTGTDKNESLDLDPPYEMYSPPVGLETHIDMGGGDDHLVIGGTIPGRIDGGDGTDSLLVLYCRTAVIRLRGTSRCTTEDSNISVRSRGWEDASVVAHGRLRLVGATGPNTLEARSDGPVRIDGGAGADQIRGVSSNRKVVVKMFGGAGPDALRGSSGRDHLAGGQGDDRLFGGAGADRLIGGEGYDTIRGGKGSDFCFGEKLTECELP